MGQSGTGQSRTCPILFMSGTFWDTFFWPELNIILAGINMCEPELIITSFCGTNIRDMSPGQCLGQCPGLAKILRTVSATNTALMVLTYEIFIFPFCNFRA